MDDGSVGGCGGGGIAPESAPQSAPTETQATAPPTSTQKLVTDCLQEGAGIVCMLISAIFLTALAATIFNATCITAMSLEGHTLVAVAENFSRLTSAKFNALSMCARIATGGLYNAVVPPMRIVNDILTATNISSVPVLDASAACCALCP